MHHDDHQVVDDRALAWTGDLLYHHYYYHVELALLGCNEPVEVSSAFIYVFFNLFWIKNWLLLKVILSYLDFSSLVSLSASTSSLAHLQPKQQIVKGENFSVAGFNPMYSQKRNHDPEHFFDVEVETRGLLGIKMVWEWEGKVSKGIDYGWFSWR